VYVVCACVCVCVCVCVGWATCRHTGGPPMFVVRIVVNSQPRHAVIMTKSCLTVNSPRLYPTDSRKERKLNVLLFVLLCCHNWELYCIVIHTFARVWEKQRQNSPQGMFVLLKSAKVGHGLWYIFKKYLFMAS